MKTIMISKLLVIALAICCLGSSCSSDRKKQQQVDTAAATSALATLAAIKVANDVYEFGRVQPHVESWENNQIELVGIKASQVGEFFLWSVTDSKPVWWLYSKQGIREDYSKKSKRERVHITYGIPPTEWEQKLPLNGTPEDIEEGIFLVYFHYSFPFIVGMRGESEICYVKHCDQSTKILSQSELGTNSWITSEEHWKIWETVNKALIKLQNPSTQNGE